ncbi:MAG: hypothetical protein ACREOS_09560 [Candidatus Dormibacteraceae bacterium]
MGLPATVARLISSGPVAIFLIFLLPFNPAGIAPVMILARKDAISAFAIVGLYVLSDVVQALVFEPFVRPIRRAADHSRFGHMYLDQVRRFGGFDEAATGGITRVMSLTAFSLVASMVFGDIMSIGLPMPRPIAWACFIVGDTLGFLILFLAALGIAPFLTDNRLYFVVTLILGFAIPSLIRRILNRRQPVGRLP